MQKLVENWREYLNEVSIKDIHNRADELGIPWDDDVKFMRWTKKLTKKSRLDDLTPEELSTVYAALESRGKGGEELWGNCGMLAIAIAEEAERLGLEPALVLVHNALDEGSLVYGDYNLFHVVVAIEDNLYDDRGEITRDQLNFDDFGEEGLDYVVEAYALNDKLRIAIRRNTNWDRCPRDFEERAREILNAAGYSEDLTETKGDGEAQRGYKEQWIEMLKKLTSGGNRYKVKGMKPAPRATLQSAPAGGGALEEAADEGLEEDAVIAIFGPSGCGKSRLKRKIVESGFDEIKSFVTRLPRGGEKADVEYEFVSPEEFSRAQEAGELVNTNKYGEHQYGTKRAELEAPGKKVMLTDVTSLLGLHEDAKGLKRALYFVYCAAPAEDELEKRHQKRFDKGEYASEAEKEQRIALAVREAAQMEAQVLELAENLPIYSVEQILNMINDGDI